MISVVIVICNLCSVLTMMNLALSIFFLTACIQNTIGHGCMYHPSPWHNTNNCPAEGSPYNCEFHLTFPLPDKRCIDDNSNDHRGCSVPTAYAYVW